MMILKYLDDLSPAFLARLGNTIAEVEGDSSAELALTAELSTLLLNLATIGQVDYSYSKPVGGRLREVADPYLVEVERMQGRAATLVEAFTKQ